MDIVHRYEHETDAVLRVGDVIEPAAARGHLSRHSQVPGYDASRVYVVDTEHDWYDAGMTHVHGGCRYAVEPLGPVLPDPEIEHWLRHYAANPHAAREAFGLDDGDRFHPNDLGAALACRTTTAARVIAVLWTQPQILIHPTG